MRSYRQTEYNTVGGSKEIKLIGSVCCGSAPTAARKW
jgi:hypothetical protein